MITPTARNDESVLVHPLGDELVVYDTAASRYYHLNATAAIIWKNCNGQNSIDALVRLLGWEPAHEQLVWEALEMLTEAHLLLGFEPRRPAELASRREFFTRAAAVGRPVLAAAVLSMVAPTVAQAQSNCSAVVCSLATEPLYSTGLAARNPDPREGGRWLKWPWA
jgi:hypothetical protein